MSDYLSLSIDNLLIIDDWPIIDNRQRDSWLFEQESVIVCTDYATLSPF